MNRVILTLVMLAGFALQGLMAQDTTFVSGTTGTTTWTSDKVYVLEGYVRVDNGETLTIEAGTVVLADTGSLENASALIVERDGMIMAEGTADEPIIFSSILDDVNNPDDFLDNQSKGLWGGIIVCGDAPTNTADNGSEQVEGIPTTLPGTVGTFGGNEPDDNSGVLKYVSIRHTGVALASNNEIQGLTLAGVGRGTEIDYVESYASDDDGIEIFGGTVNLKHIAISFGSDDMFDLDQGWTGKVQYLFILQSADFGDRLGEWDGADTPEDGTPFGSPTIYNMTMIGSAPAGTNNRTITFRANGGGKVYNSVFMEQARGIDVQIKSDSAVSTNSYERFENGDLVLSNNVFWNIAGNSPADLFSVSPVAEGWVLADSASIVDAAEAALSTAMEGANTITNPGIGGLSYTDDGMLDPRMSDASIYTDLHISNDSYFENPGYKGAFGPGKDDLWIRGWTALDTYGYLATEAAGDTIDVTGTTGAGKTIWTNNNVYRLNGYVRVDNGDTLCIQGGTVVLADTGSLENASALIIERDGYLAALGTAEAPIIFSSVLDDVNDPMDFLDNQAKGLWGGIIMCGDAPTNTADNGTEQVEGIPTTLPATVGTFGGNEPEDNSGILKYVSIRHSGVALASNNEIQGLTLAGVGNGTEIDYIESYASDDDGIEIFGGTVNMKHVSIAFAADDMFDLDQGWTGNVQWMFILQSADFGDRTGEWDGADTPEDGTPFGSPTIYNMTMIGNEPAGTNNRAITFRANGGGKVYNSIIMEQSRGIDIQIKSDSAVSENSYDRFVAGDLVMSNNVFWNVAGNNAADLFGVSPVAEGWVLADSASIVDAADADVNATLIAANQIADPEIAGLSYVADGGLDPRFAGWAANSDFAPAPGFFTPTLYKGAFSPAKDGIWAKGWTALDHYGYFGDADQEVVSIFEPTQVIAGVKFFPNPTQGVLNIKAEDFTTADVFISIFDMAGRQLAAETVKPLGTTLDAQVDMSKLRAGLYIVNVRQGDKLASSRIIVE